MSDICAICGRPAECTHHLIGGVSKRHLSDEDSITVRLCNGCHNMAISPIDRIHGNSMAIYMSKMIGQLIYEKRKIASGCTPEEARKKFMDRYSINYLMEDM